MSELDNMRSRLLDIINPTINYTQDDFNKEFGFATSSLSDTFRLTVKFVNKSQNQNPSYATPGSSGFDLRANLSEDIVIQPLERKLVPTGLFFEIPIGFEIQVRPRSGLALKSGITVLNTPGTIDSDYRGEVMVILINMDSNPFTIRNGDRIAQAVIATVLNENTFKFSQIGDIDENTNRGSGGFGSTGTK